MGSKASSGRVQTRRHVIDGHINVPSATKRHWITKKSDNMAKGLQKFPNDSVATAAMLTATEVTDSLFWSYDFLCSCTLLSFLLMLQVHAPRQR